MALRKMLSSVRCVGGIGCGGDHGGMVLVKVVATLYVLPEVVTTKKAMRDHGIAMCLQNGVGGKGDVAVGTMGVHFLVSELGLIEGLDASGHHPRRKRLPHFPNGDGGPGRKRLPP